MSSNDYTDRYSGMADGELAQLIFDGPDSLSDIAREAFDAELQRRGLSYEALAREYPMMGQRGVGEEPNRIGNGTSLLRKAFRFKGAKRWLLIVFLINVAGLVLVAFESREAKLDALYLCATNQCGTRDAQAAFRKLATYDGKHAHDLIDKIATRPLGNISGNQEAAIKIIGERGNTEAAEQLLPLLRPYEGLAVRRAVADALVQLPCSAECVASILYYEERMWRGDPTPELLMHELSKQLETEREEIDRQLGKVLLRDRSETMKALVQTYGLGNVAVSPFALYLVTHLNLTDACPFLDIDERFKPMPNEQQFMPRFAEMRRSIDNARKQLNCPN
ncbi:MAG: hypothetical protein WBM04_19825 [Candidatus Korobacteraceae bacterium]